MTWKVWDKFKRGELELRGGHTGYTGNIISLWKVCEGIVGMKDSLAQLRKFCHYSFLSIPYSPHCWFTQFTLNGGVLPSNNVPLLMACRQTLRFPLSLPYRHTGW